MPYQTITPRQASELLANDARCAYLDVRSEQEFAAGHPVGARNIPIAHLSGGGMVANEDFLAVVATNFPKEALIVVGCKMGGRSARACEILANAGWKNLKNVDGGFDGRGNAVDPDVRAGWRGCSLPISNTPAAGASYAELKQK
jgi:rhodanese-related sulfurtransferase